MKKRALISVYDKKGVLDFASRLSKLGYEILSTGGTLALLAEGGVPAVSVSEITKFPECLDGRVKTLHPGIHAGILANRSLESHMRELERLGVGTIDLVAINLYPFEKAISSPAHTLAEAIENIDIGGPAMLRSAAKNYEGVIVLADASDFGPVIEELEKTGGLALGERKRLAAKAFRLTSFYDSLVSRYLTQEEFPETYAIGLRKGQSLRYGENPQQAAAFYEDPMDPALGVGDAEILSGKALSYNNIADANAALEIALEYWDSPAAVAVKHENPCGIAVAQNICEAYEKARDADPVSIFGGVVALTRPVDEAAARLLSETFLEIVLAPAFGDEALALLKEKKNLRLLRLPPFPPAMAHGKMAKKVLGGMLLSDYDEALSGELSAPTKRKPTEEESASLLFAFKAAKHLKSNAIAIAKGGVLVGAGPGQTSRVGALEIALKMAGERAKGAVLASDAFFPFPDCVEEAAKAGITAIIQPGGSSRDADSIAEADRAGIAMVFTGMRHFRH
jgi:phosphoribosylaminoimidazolecarboxamide formyltransferase/IMP cyclohydrolase